MSARISTKPGGGSIDSDFLKGLLTASMPRDTPIGESEEAVISTHQPDAIRFWSHHAMRRSWNF